MMMSNTLLFVPDVAINYFVLIKGKNMQKAVIVYKRGLHLGTVSPMALGDEPFLDLSVVQKPYSIVDQFSMENLRLFFW
jgi:hypothetical protein